MLKYRYSILSNIAGTNVTLVSAGELEDDTFINAHLVENGYAVVMTVPPNIKYVDLFVELQESAIENNKGLWR